jgi:hypothetical protein
VSPVTDGSEQALDDAWGELPHGELDDDQHDGQYQHGQVDHRGGHRRQDVHCGFGLTDHGGRHQLVIVGPIDGEGDEGDADPDQHAKDGDHPQTRRDVLVDLVEDDPHLLLPLSPIRTFHGRNRTVRSA